MVPVYPLVVLEMVRLGKPAAVSVEYLHLCVIAADATGFVVHTTVNTDLNGDGFKRPHPGVGRVGMDLDPRQGRRGVSTRNTEGGEQSGRLPAHERDFSLLPY